MPVNLPDERRIIKPSEEDFTNPPLPSVTAIDTTIDDVDPFGFGTGVVISPNYVLTAAHVLYDKSVTLLGQNNNDRLFGDNGNDLLEGGNGNDTLTGGGGQDNFVWVNSNQGVDQITDFTVADDTLLLAAAGFSGIGANSIVNPQMLTIGTNATTSTHRFIYSAGSGDLFYDSDGVGANPQVQLAQLGANLALTSDNFAIIA